jgi:hypothetical protein
VETIENENLEKKMQGTRCEIGGEGLRIGDAERYE